MKKNNKGFTLAELLIVVAIIAVLVAIAIPIFTKRLENSRETTDVANLRSAYAAGQVALLQGDIPTGAGTSYYDPDSGTGLTGSATKQLGKGTAVDGGFDKTNAGLPTCIVYSNTTDYQGKAIKLTFAGGSLSQVTFANS